MEKFEKGLSMQFTEGGDIVLNLDVGPDEYDEVFELMLQRVDAEDIIETAKVLNSVKFGALLQVKWQWLKDDLTELYYILAERAQFNAECVLQYCDMEDFEKILAILLKRGVRAGWLAQMTDLPHCEEDEAVQKATCLMRAGANAGAVLSLCKNETVVQRLFETALAHGLDINGAITCIGVAPEFYHQFDIQSLIERGADPEKVFENIFTQDSSNMEDIRCLLENGLKPNRVTKIIMSTPKDWKVSWLIQNFELLREYDRDMNLQRLVDYWGKYVSSSMILRHYHELAEKGIVVNAKKLAKRMSKYDSRYRKPWKKILGDYDIH